MKIYLLVLLTFFVSSCASVQKTDLNSGHDPQLLSELGAVFGVIGFVTETTSITPVADGEYAVTANLVEAKMEILTNVIGFVSEKTIRFEVVVDHHNEIGTVQGPIFLLGEKNDKNSKIEVHYWDRPTTTICVPKEETLKDKFPKNRVKEEGVFPDWEGNVKNYYLTEEMNIEKIGEDRIFYSSNGNKVCFETNFYTDHFGQFKDYIKR